MSLADIKLPVGPGDHVMIDLECLGADRSDPIITSIGAVLFNRKTSAFEWPTFHVDIDIDSSVSFGNTVTRSTLNWWLTEADDEARKALVRGQSSRNLASQDEALKAFAVWFSGYDVKTIWANGAADDLTWLRSAYDSCELSAPWNYSQARCFRTLKNMLDPLRSLSIVPELEHHALYDAKAQAQTLLRMNDRMKRLLRPEEDDR